MRDAVVIAEATQLRRWRRDIDGCRCGAYTDGATSLGEPVSPILEAPVVMFEAATREWGVAVADMTVAQEAHAAGRTDVVSLRRHGMTVEVADLGGGCPQVFGVWFYAPASDHWTLRDANGTVTLDLRQAETVTRYMPLNGLRVIRCVATDTIVSVEIQKPTSGQL